MIVLPALSLIVTLSGLSFVGHSTGNPVPATVTPDQQGRCNWCNSPAPQEVVTTGPPHAIANWIFYFENEVADARLRAAHQSPFERTHHPVDIPTGTSFGEYLTARALVSYGGFILFSQFTGQRDMITLRYTPGDPDEWAQSWMTLNPRLILREFTAQFTLVYAPGRSEEGEIVVPELGDREDVESCSFTTTWIRETRTSDRQLRGTRPERLRYYKTEFSRTNPALAEAKIRTKITIKWF